MVKILHIADVHLDAPFSLFDVEKAQARRNELRGTFTSIMMYAKMKEADIVIIAGDLFDSDYVTKDTLSLIISQFEDNKNCRFVITPGNHDPFTPTGAYAKTKFPDNVYIFDDENIKRISFDELGVDIYGFAFTSAEHIENPLLSSVYADKNKINILALHTDMAKGGKDAPVSADDIARTGADYAALGHIHAGSEIKRAGDTYYAYSGCPEGRSFDECGIKGGIFITAENENGKKKLTFERPRFCKRHYEKITVDISGCTTHEQMCAEIKKKISPLGYGKDTLLRIKLEGVISPEARLDADKTDPAELGVFYAEIKDTSVPLLDYKELKEDISIKGALFRELLPKLGSEDERERRIASLALRYGLSALTGAEITDF